MAGIAIMTAPGRSAVTHPIPPDRAGRHSRTTGHDHEGIPEMNTRPNIVLVHGAFADGSSWSGVIERLQADGYHVTAPQFPLTALADDVARLRQVLDLQDGPAIVAGHSYGGQVMTALGADAPDVAGLVYIAALGLDQGESLGGLLTQGPARRACRPGHRGRGGARPPGPRTAGRRRGERPAHRPGTAHLRAGRRAPSPSGLCRGHARKAVHPRGMTGYPGTAHRGRGHSTQS